MFDKFLIYLPEDNQNEDPSLTNSLWDKETNFYLFVNFIRSLKLRCSIAVLVV